MARKVQKELTPAESVKIVKKLVKDKKRINKADWIPGNIIYTYYLAKDMTQVYDRTPLVLILRRNKTHTLGLNFHWIPFKMRDNLARYILKLNKKNIEQGKPLEFSYRQLKPILKNYGYAPCIRLYINHRFRSSGTVIPPDRLVEVARLRTETFTKGKYTAEQLYAKAVKDGRRRAKARKRKK